MQLGCKYEDHYTEWMSTEWHPYPHQEKALASNAFEVMMGGARGPGKTDAGLVWLTEYVKHPRYRALVIRKNADDLSDWVDRATRMYYLLGAKIAYRPAEIVFPSGAKIKTGHLKDDQAYTKYMGQEYQRQLIEELTQIPEEKRYLQLIASCRSTLPELKPQVFSTTNPGGVGHAWVKKRFVDPAIPGTKFADPTSGRTRIFIPCTVDDNPALMTNDPDYVKGLDALRDTDPELWKAWRLGDWNTFAGQFFKEFLVSKHVIPPFVPHPEDCVIVGGMDWGRTAPFAFYLAALYKCHVDGTAFYRSKVFFECYGTDHTPHEWAEIIKAGLRRYSLHLGSIAWIRGDPAMFTKGQDNSTSIADQFKEDGVVIKPASNDRIGGWENLHDWFSLAPDGKPYLQFTENCLNLIETLPGLVHDENKVEDVDTTGLDHAADAIRYLHKHLKWIDGRVGAARTHTTTALWSPGQGVRETAIMIDGKQESVNIDLFR